MKKEYSAGGVVYRRKNNHFEFALILDLYGKWTFPKGHIEENEQSQDAALREITEEIGLTQLKIVKLLAQIDYEFTFNEEMIHKFVDFYLIEAFGDQDLTGQANETQDVKWFTPEQAMDIIDYKKQNDPILTQAIDTIDTPKK